ncbi:MAG: imelysin family protein [Anaerolineae bacterium]
MIAAWLLLSGFVIQSQPAAQAAEFSRRAMLENIAEHIILPLHDFLQTTDALRMAADTFQTSPTPEDLESLQDAWRATALLWYKVTLFPFGRVTFVYHSRIANDLPIATQIIEQFINGTDTLDADALAVFGSNVVGLRTVEYLIFDPDGGNDAVMQKYTSDPSAARRAQYLTLTVDDLYATVAEILAVWSPDGSNYGDEFVNADDPNSVQGSISMLANRMMGALEGTVNMSIGWPLGTLSGMVQPEIVESRYSGYTIPEITSLFEVLRDTFNGTSAEGDGLGFDDYLDYLGATYNDISLSEAINQQFDTLLADLDVIREPLGLALVNNVDEVQRVYDDGRALVVLMKTDMTSRLGITITFNDSDGD